MIETLPERPTVANIGIPADVAAAFAAFRGEMTGRSQIVWGEHCSECAYPACYAHCAFYTPRSDFDCRRFEAGFEPLAADPALHRVRFRKWGKLEGQGPAALRLIPDADARDRRDGRVSGLIGGGFAPHALKQSLARLWNTRKRIVSSCALSTDAFMVEVWASDGKRHPFTLTFLNSGDHGGRLFQTRFEADGVYRRLAVPAAEIAARIDLTAPYLVQIEPVGEAEGVQVVFGVCDFVALREPLAPSEPVSIPDAIRPAKVVVWDLDETLWSGVLAEDGVDGVRVHPEAVAAVKMLDARGVLQSVASKNDASQALAALKAFGLDGYFLHPQVHWNPKSSSIAAIAKALNLGLDSVVFIDDQPFERGEVEAAHPMVRTLAHMQVGSLATHPWFDLPTTAESRQRRALYQEEAHRAEAFETAGADYAAFLRGSQIKLSVDRLTAGDVERVFELSQRTNQLNFTGRKYARKEVQALLASKAGEEGLCLRCNDRFGDYGLIGFAAADYSKGVVGELFMSCRVQRKRVEQALFDWLRREMAQRGIFEMRVVYTPTGRNGAALEMLQALSFSPSDSGTWVRPCAQSIPESDIVSIVAGRTAEAA